MNNNDIILKKIRIAHFKINFLFLLEIFLKNFIKIGIIFGVIFSLIQYFLRINLFNYSLWLIFNIIISIIFTIKHIFNLPDKKEIANILDDKFNTKNLFSAALYCIEKEYNKAIHKIIIKNAVRLSNFKLNMIINYKGVFRSFLFAFFLSCLIFLSLIVMQQKHFIFSNKKKYYENFNNKIEEGAIIKSPETISKFLAKDDAALRKNIEKAIKNNDFKELNKLIVKSQNNFNKKSEKASNLEKSELEKESLVRDELINFLLNEYSKRLNSLEKDNPDNLNDLNNNLNYSDKSLGVNEDIEDKEKNLNTNIINTLLSFYNKKLAKNKNKNESEINGEGLGSDNEEDAEDDISANISKGEGSGRTANSEIEDRNLEKKLILDKKEDEKLFEYFIKEKDPAINERDFFLNENISNNIPFIKTKAPVDYEEFIKNYFLSLNKQKNNTEENKNGKR